MSRRWKGTHLPLHLFVPGLHAVIELGNGARPAAFGVHRLADDHGDHALLLRPTCFWPELAGVMRDRQHRKRCIDRQCRAATGELADAAVGNPGALGEYQHPDAILQQFIALLRHMLERGLGVVAIDGDRSQHGHGPAEKRYVQQRALEHLAQRFEIGREEERFPGALMVRLNHAGLIGHVLGAFDFIADAQKHLAQP
ncbi:hypothetical protein D3C73_1091390 [compost metagenome]